MKLDVRLRRALLVPMVVTLLALTVYPTVYALVVSLTDAQGGQPGRFVGLKNYTDLFSHPTFWDSLVVTLVFTVAAVVCEVVLATALILLLFDLRTEHRWLRAMLLLPMAATPVAVMFGWKIILDPTLGVLNYFIGDVFHLGRPEWLGSPTTALLTLIVVDIWQWTPFILVILFGGMTNVSKELVEASLIDNANWWQRARYVILPQLKPFLLVALLFRGVDALRTFDSIQVLTGGGPGYSTTTLNMLAFRQGIQYLNFGQGAAVALILLVITMVFGQLALRFAARGRYS